MAPPTSPIEPESTTATPLATPSAIPPPVPVETHPNRIKPGLHFQKTSDPSRLAPEDAYKALTPPRLRPTALDGTVISSSAAAANAAAAALRPAVASLRKPPAIPPVAARLEQERRAARALRKKHKPKVWKKLLWVKQRGYPDNYTDPATFLDNLQRNPKLRPYEFWPLVADSTVIVQHVCSMVVFVSAYAGIYQDRLSPVAVVVCGTIATVIGWVMWDQWKCEEQSSSESDTTEHTLGMNGNIYKSPLQLQDDKSSTSSSNEARRPSTAMNGHLNGSTNGHVKKGLGLSLSTSNLAAKNAQDRVRNSNHHGPSLSKSSLQSISPIDPLMEQNMLSQLGDGSQQPNEHTLSRVFSHKSQHSSASYHYIPQSPTTLPPTVSPRNQARLKTFKSAILIYFALLGLSPILKSLTKSTSSDSIWALATWLLIINVFFFDYGSQYIPSKSSTRKHATAEELPDLSMGRPNGSLHMKPSHASFSTTTSSIRPPLSTINSTAVYPSAGAQTSSAPTPSAAMLPPQNTYPSSLSTNAAVMASTVLASRLPTTTAVFSLTLFSIQVFGLFPLFRRHLRSRSLPLHILLTVALVLMASAGLGLILSQSYTHRYGDCGFCLSWCAHIALRSVIGITIGSFGTIFVTGGCAWWLISLQRYKNVVIGPWDPAKPMLAGGRVHDGS